jgi:hypothetical protein
MQSSWELTKNDYIWLSQEINNYYDTTFLKGRQSGSACGYEI